MKPPWLPRTILSAKKRGTPVLKIWSGLQLQLEVSLPTTLSQLPYKIPNHRSTTATYPLKQWRARCHADVLEKPGLFM
jgi:hypothetical protein